MRDQENVRCVQRYREAIIPLLAKARVTKPLGHIEPALNPQDFHDGIHQLESLQQETGIQAFAGIETACRDIFYRLLVGLLPQFWVCD